MFIKSDVNSMKAKLKKAMFIFVCVAILGTLACTGYQNFKDDRLIIKKSDSEIHLPKAAIAKACNREATYCIDDVLLILGEISGTTLSDLEELARTHGDKEISTICFDSRGGNTAKSSVLGERILKNGLSTCMAERYFLDDKNGIRRELENTQCNSACSYLLLASNKRIAIGTHFKIATHSAGVNLSLCFCNMPLSSGFMNSFMFESLLDREDNPDREAHLQFLALSQKVSFSEAYYLSNDDLETFAVFTDRH